MEGKEKQGIKFKWQNKKAKIRSRRNEREEEERREERRHIFKVVKTENERGARRAEKRRRRETEVSECRGRGGREGGDKMRDEERQQGRGVLKLVGDTCGPFVSLQDLFVSRLARSSGEAAFKVLGIFILFTGHTQLVFLMHRGILSTPLPVPLHEHRHSIKEPET